MYEIENDFQYHYGTPPRPALDVTAITDKCEIEGPGAERGYMAVRPGYV
jgi:hypothetical protein